MSGVPGLNCAQMYVPKSGCGGRSDFHVKCSMETPVGDTSS